MKTPGSHLRMASHILVLAIAMTGWIWVAQAEEACDSACLARKAQDPLADVRAIMTDNTISFGTADDETSYGFLVQPVYAIPTDHGVNVIARAVIPIVGVPEGAGLPRLGPDPVTGSGTKWGISDIMLQSFITPHSDSDIKWGFGPQVSLRTRTSDQVGGAGWGAGFGAVFFGAAGSLAYGALASHHWGQDEFSLTSLQPIVFYGLDLFGGSYVGYSNTVTYNWNADSDDRWQVPLGLTAGKTFGLGDGYALDVSLGGYKLAVNPTGGADWQFKFGASLFFP